LCVSKEFVQTVVSLELYQTDHFLRNLVKHRTPQATV